MCVCVCTNVMSLLNRSADVADSLLLLSNFLQICFALSHLRHVIRVHADDIRLKQVKEQSGEVWERPAIVKEIQL